MKRLKILLAEDEDINRLVAEDLLTDYGHEVVSVRDGKQALERLDQDDYDVALLDIRMPVMSGDEAVREIRANENRDSRLPVIALTAYALEEERRRFMGSGFDAYLTKPLRIKDLERVLAELRPR